MTGLLTSLDTKIGSPTFYNIHTCFPIIPRDDNDFEGQLLVTCFEPWFDNISEKLKN